MYMIILDVTTNYNVKRLPINCSKVLAAPWTQAIVVVVAGAVDDEVHLKRQGETTKVTFKF